MIVMFFEYRCRAVVLNIPLQKHSFPGAIVLKCQDIKIRVGYEFTGGTDFPSKPDPCIRCTRDEIPM